MKRFIITTAILSLIVISAHAQRYEPRNRSHKAHIEKNRHTIRKVNHGKVSQSEDRKHHPQQISRHQSIKDYRVAHKQHKKTSFRSFRNNPSPKSHTKKANIRGYSGTYYKGYTRRLHRDGNINHYHKNRIWSADKYHIYPRRPHFSIRWRPAWKTFYRYHFPSFKLGVHSMVITIPAYETTNHLHESAGVYGRVYEVLYDRRSNELYLYLGAPYPRQDFTIIVTGRLAREMKRFPHSYFLGQDFMVSGFISEYRNQPEMVIKYREQIKRF